MPTRRSSNEPRRSLAAKKSTTAKRSGPKKSTPRTTATKKAAPRTTTTKKATPTTTATKKSPANPPSDALSPLLTRLAAAWTEKRPDFLRQLRPPATEEVLDRVATLAQHALPTTFRQLYRWHDGAKDIDAAFEEFFGWCSLEHIRRAKTMLDQIESDGLFVAWRAGSWWNPGWLPFLQFNGEDHVCIDLVGSLGLGAGVVFVRRNSNDIRKVLAPSFDAWLEMHVALTEIGPGGGTEDAWIEHFVSKKADAVRSRLSPGFPTRIKALRADD